MEAQNQALLVEPLFPGIMAMTSRQFVNTIGIVSSVTLVSIGCTTMVLPTLMGLLIAVIGIIWVLLFRAFCCLMIIVLLILAIRHQRHLLHVADSGITINEEISLSTKV